MRLKFGAILPIKRREAYCDKSAKKEDFRPPINRVNVGGGTASGLCKREMILTEVRQTVENQIVWLLRLNLTQTALQLVSLQCSFRERI
jgi:hypothetical protein